MMTSLSGQLNIPNEELQTILSSTLMNFITEEISNGVNDPQQISTDLTSYLSRPEVQESLQTQLRAVIDPTLLQQQLTTTIQTQMGNVMTQYIEQITTIIQDQITARSQQLMTQIMSQLPQQLRNSISIDTEAFADAFQMNMDEKELSNLLNTLMNPTENTLEKNLTLLGYADEKEPSQINIYPINFQAKQDVLNFLDDYNDAMTNQKKTDQVIYYTDLVGTMMTSVTDIVNTISAALIAFVAISLVVSSIMIGVITYISVIERRKEIGILRALGASKLNISNVFNAETLIIGFVSGMLGVCVTALLCIPANIIVEKEFEIENIAQLPIEGALILIIVSMLLTFIAGLFPASAAAKKDPVEALRSE